MAEQIHRAFMAFLRAECGHGPVLLVLEDLQWSDALTIKRIDRIRSTDTVVTHGAVSRYAAAHGEAQDDGARKVTASKAGARKVTASKTAGARKVSPSKTAGARKVTASKAARKVTARKVTARKVTASKVTARKVTASKGARKVTASPKTDQVLSEIEDNLISYAFNRRSPAMDREGRAWRKVAFAGSRALLAKLVKHPVAQTLETLTLVGIDAKADKVVQVLAKGPPLAAVRELRLGLLPEGQDDSVGFEERSCGDLSALARACPRLDVLRLLCPGFVAGDHPTLRVLDARTGAWPASVASLASASLPALEELHLGFGVEEDEALYPSLIWTADTLAPLLDGEALPALRRLCLWPMPEDDGLVELARASPLGRRVKIELRSVEEDLEADSDAYVL